LELTQMYQCNLQFLIIKLQKEINNKTMRSQLKCWIQKRCNTATIGEPTERGTHYWQNTGGRHSLSSSNKCTQLLQYRMKQDTDWNTASMSYNPLELYQLIEKMTCTDRGSIPIHHCVWSGTWFLLILAGDNVQPALVQKIQHKGWCWIGYQHNLTA
jgi:hypothetical protein